MISCRLCGRPFPSARRCLQWSMRRCGWAAQATTPSSAWRGRAREACSSRCSLERSLRGTARSKPMVCKASRATGSAVKANSCLTRPPLSKYQRRPSSRRKKAVSLSKGADEASTNRAAGYCARGTGPTGLWMTRTDAEGLPETCRCSTDEGSLFLSSVTQ
eukprot:scaffold1193_cov159-Ochromonas_danica.AAC.21